MSIVKTLTIALHGTGTPGFAVAQSTALRYKAPTRPTHYDVKITVDSPIEKSTYQGRIVFEGTNAGANLALTYKGGLKESTEKKRTSSSSNSGPFGFAPPRPPSPFDLERNRGPGALRQTTAKLSLAPNGEVLSLEGESQIPLPLGHLSLLVFETLPDEAKSTWSTSNGVLLGKPAKPSRGSPFDPFGRPAEPGSSSAGSETASYTVKETSGYRVTIDKKYTLNSPHTTPPFELSGGGPLVFDTEQGMFVSCKLSYDLKIKDTNVEIRIPVTVEYKFLTKEQIDREASERALTDLKLRQNDAAGGCDGIKNGHYGFHTDKEQSPWWQVDLGKSINLAGVVIYNRCNDKDMEKRADHIRVLLSADGKSWTQVYEHNGTSFFGFSDGKPLKVPLAGKETRFVRLQIPVFDYFHLDEVEVYEKGNPRNIAQGKPAEQSSANMKFSSFD